MLHNMLTVIMAAMIAALLTTVLAAQEPLVVCSCLRQLHLSHSDISSIILQKNLLYPRLLWRHHFFGPWTYTQVTIQLIYLAAIAFCIMFRVSNTTEAADRAGHLSLINMILVYSG